MSARMLDIFLIEHHRAYGRISRSGDTSSYSFVHAAISSALSSLWEKIRKLLPGDFGRVASE